MPGQRLERHAQAVPQQRPSRRFGQQQCAHAQSSAAYASASGSSQRLPQAASIAAGGSRGAAGEVEGAAISGSATTGEAAGSRGASWAVAEGMGQRAKRSAARERADACGCRGTGAAVAGKRMGSPAKCRKQPDGLMRGNGASSTQVARILAEGERRAHAACQGAQDRHIATPQHPRGPPTGCRTRPDGRRAAAGAPGPATGDPDPDPPDIRPPTTRLARRGRGAAGGATPPAVRAERKERGSEEATAGESGGAAGDDNTRGRASESCADGVGEERRGPRDDESWSWLPKDRHSRSADSGAGGAAAGVTGESERERRRKAG